MHLVSHVEGGPVRLFHRLTVAAAVLALAGCGRGGDKPAEEKTNALIQPVAKLELGAPAAPAAGAPASTAPAVAAAAPAAAPAPAVASGADKGVYDKVCIACHAAGVAGAPKLGDKAAWAPRLAAGVDGLVKSVVNGKNAMPPRAGNPALTDAEIRTTVEYMVAQAK